MVNQLMDFRKIDMDKMQLKLKTRVIFVYLSKKYGNRSRAWQETDV
jgi:hypothetical protein